MTPEHLHLAINHLPVIGMASAVIPLLVGLLGRSRAALVSGLLLAAVCGWSLPLVMRSGEEARARYEQPDRHGIRLDAEVAQALAVHARDAESRSLVIYMTAVAATLALLLAVVRMRGVILLSWMVLLLCLWSVFAGLAIADSGLKVRRPDFRAELCPPSLGEDLPQALHRRLDIPA